MNPVTAATPVAVKQVAFWEQKLASLGLALLPLPASHRQSGSDVIVRWCKGCWRLSRGFRHSFSAGHHCGICKAWSAMQRPIQEPESHWNDHVLQCNCSCLQQQPAEGRQGLANGHVDRVALRVAKTVGNWLSSLVSKWKISKDVPGSSLGTMGFNYKEIPKKKNSSPLAYHLGWQEYTSVHWFKEKKVRVTYRQWMSGSRELERAGTWGDITTQHFPALPGIETFTVSKEKVQWNCKTQSQPAITHRPASPSAIPLISSSFFYWERCFLLVLGSCRQPLLLLLPKYS